MKVRMLMCSYCKEKFPEEELTQVTKAKRGCKSCLDTQVREAKEYKDLIDYICQGFNQKAPLGHQLKDIKKFKDMGYSYTDIQWTLYFIACIVGKKMDGRLGLIPFYYNQAKEHFRRVEIAKKSAEKMEEQKEIVIIRKSCDTSRAKRDKTRYVNIEEL